MLLLIGSLLLLLLVDSLPLLLLLTGSLLLLLLIGILPPLLLLLMRPILLPLLLLLLLPLLAVKDTISLSHCLRASAALVIDLTTTVSKCLFGCRKETILRASPQVSR